MNDYWLLRDLTGDAYALAVLPYHYIRVQEYGQTAVRGRDPLALSGIVHDYRNNTDVGYTHEVIEQIDWETLMAFGIPVAKEVIDDNGKRWLEIW